ncbi:MAG: type IV pilus modification PilV family protein [Oligoflexus sp.]
MKPRNVVKHKPGERSFTIIETLIALGIMLTVVLEVVGTQGNVVAFANYSRRVTEATWLAKRIMAQVEYHWHHKEFKELDVKLEEQKFDVGFNPSDELEFTYNLTIEEWKLPIFDILSSGGPQTEEEEEEERYNPTDQSSMMSGMAGIDQVINTVFEGHILKVAHVEVFWPEGARRNSITLSYLLTNQRALDAYLLGKGQAIDKLLKDVETDVGGETGGGGDNNSGGGGRNNNSGGGGRNNNSGGSNGNDNSGGSGNNNTGGGMNPPN